jgi:hypothetical protein
MTVVRGRADSFVAADSPLVRAKIAKSAKAREERQQLQRVSLAFLRVPSRLFAAFARTGWRSSGTSPSGASTTNANLS